jgi:hypothetical protein
MARLFAPLLALLLAFGFTPAAAQPVPDDWPKAAPEDVASVDAIIASLYDVISGPAGEARDWDRFRSLFHPEARLTPILRTQQGNNVPVYLTPDTYITRAGAGLEESGFFEVEIHRAQDSYGPLVHLFSTYESRRHAEDEEPFARGINSIQLVFDGSRWWVANITWQGETAELPIPAEYLQP